MFRRARAVCALLTVIGRIVTVRVGLKTRFLANAD